MLSSNSVTHDVRVRPNIITIELEAVLGGINHRGRAKRHWTAIRRAARVIAHSSSAHTTKGYSTCLELRTTYIQSRYFIILI